jgi:hypothetical protein
LHPITGAPLGVGFTGGDATVMGGMGGAGWSDCTPTALVDAGGAGGQGGTATVEAGVSQPGAVIVTTPIGTIMNFGDGGNGGNGYGPGDGGAAGLFTQFGPTVVTSSFRPGIAGSLCPHTEVGTTWTVPPGGDPNGHFAFVQFQTLLKIFFSRSGSAVRADATVANQAAPTSTAITVVGAAPWITLAGTISASGVVSATGTGTVAGFAGTRVTLNGTITNGAFSGTVVAGSQTPFTLPGGPITYSVSGPVRSP